MSFLETPRFPTTLAFGSSGGVEYATDKAQTRGAAEMRRDRWPYGLVPFDVSRVARDRDEAMVIITLFRRCKGQKHGFRVKDPLDHEAAAGEGILTLIDTSPTSYQMKRRYGDGTLYEDRTILKPVAGTVTVAGGGTYGIDYTSGVVSHIAGAAPTGWIGEYDTPCRFNTDKLVWSVGESGIFTFPGLELMELLEVDFD